MKKTLIALAALAFLSSTAFAEGLSVSVEQEHFTYRQAGLYQTGTALLGSYAFAPTWTVDGRYQYGRVSNGTTNNTAEFGLSKAFAMSDKLTLTTRVAVGRMYPSGVESISYRLVDLTGTYQLTPKLALTVGERFRNNFRGHIPTHSPEGWVDYSLTSKDILTVGYTRINGGLDAKSVTGTYTRLF